MAESVKTPGASVSAMPTPSGPAVAGNGSNSQPRSLFDAINPDAANNPNGTSNAATANKSDKNKTTGMKTEGVKPLTALGPILGILGLVIALVLWKQNHTAAIIVGLIGLAILALWLIARRAKKSAESTSNKKRQPDRATHNSRGSGGYQRRPFGWAGRRGRQAHRSHDGRSGPYSNGSQSRESWWRRGRHNPLNRDRRRSRDGSANPNRSNHTGDASSRYRRSSWWPTRKNRDSDHVGNGQPSSQRRRRRSRNSESRGSGRSLLHPFGGGRSRHRSSDSSGGTSGNHGGGGRNGSHGSRHRGSSGSNRRHRWYKPWTWTGRNHDSGSSGSDPNSDGPGGKGPHGSNGNGNGRGKRLRSTFRRLWNWQLYDANEESVNGYHDPNRRNRFRDKWNAWRTHRQRENVNYAGFNVDSDGNAKPHYSRWRNWRNQARGRNWYTFGPENPKRATATRMDQPTARTTGPALSGHSLSLGSSSGPSYTQPATSEAPATATAASNGGRTMTQASNGAMHTVGGRLEAATHASGAANSHRSAVWHVMVANQLRAWAARLANSDNPYHRASANTYAHMAAQANAVAQNDAQLAAAQMSESARALGGGQRSIGS